MLSRIFSYFVSRNSPLAFILGRNVSTTPALKSTIDRNEVEKFSKFEWEEANILSTFNSIRVPFVRDGILATNGIVTKKPLPLSGFKILDVGCGGGLLSEPLARLGANVTGLDPVEESIKYAAEHAALDDSIQQNVTYVCGTPETFSQSDKFDAIVCSEVIEHVNNVDLFLESCVNLLKENGSLFFTTFNRTAVSYVAGILMAEFVLGVIPKGTHEWNKFISPQELSEKLESLNCRTVSVNGILYNPLTKKFVWSSNMSCNYALHAMK